jgi:Flp pilus assembly protein TadG
MNIHRRMRERGIVVLMTAVIMLTAIPLIGLAIDGTMLYIVKCRLQGAVDGAALAAARALARGSDTNAQKTAAQNAAVAYVKLNFPDGYFFANNVSIGPSNVDVNMGVANQRTITVSATVSEPTLFMRYLNYTATTVGATAQAVRRDVNIAIVMDRSGSLAQTNSCEPLKQAAINFTNKFAETRDFLSLVTFASSTNTDFSIASNFKSATPSIPSLVSAVQCTGGTSSAQGLWYGYNQLLNQGQPGALNVILFFTDGLPSGVNVNVPLAGSSGCLKPHPGPPRYVNGVYAYASDTSNNIYFYGLLNPYNSGTAPNPDNNITADSQNATQCNFWNSWPRNATDTSDFLGVPTTDVYGDTLNNGYQPITLNGARYIDLGNSANAKNMTTNAADDAATRIRNGAVAPAALPTRNLPTAVNSLNNVIIFSIGLMNRDAVPDALIRISNDPRSSIYDRTKPAGAFISAPTATDIDHAFTQVASEILRLSR